jgi:hypothetical protein
MKTTASNGCRMIPLPWLVLFALPGLSMFAARAQGPLTPPGPPGETMKTLQQVEPRTPISTSTNITEPGSYYLTTNVTAGPGEIGLTIAANDVTVDLNGFTLRSLGGIANGILVIGARTNLSVLNGTIRDWSAVGISAAAAENGRFERLQLLNNAGYGLLTGPNSLVLGCVASGASNSVGLLVAYGSRVKDCVVQNHAYGISAGQGSIISGCTAQNCSELGISGGFYSMITECAVSGTGSNGIVAQVAIISRCVVSGLSGVGIDAGNVSTVSDCVVQNTRGNGIQGMGGNVIRGNVLSNIGINTNPAAIHVSGNNNSIQANTATFCNGYGLRVTATGNLVVQNHVRNTAGSYSEIVGGNDVGPILNAATATNAWANFGF